MQNNRKWKTPQICNLIKTIDSQNFLEKIQIICRAFHNYATQTQAFAEQIYRRCIRELSYVAAKLCKHLANREEEIHLLIVNSLIIPPPREEDKEEQSSNEDESILSDEISSDENDTEEQYSCILSMEPDRKSKTYALDFIHTHISAWSNVTENDIKVTKMPSGTNHVLKIQNTKGAEPKCLIYRVFTTSETVDNSQEKRVFAKLSELGIGPQSYGADQYCRLEYFLQGFKDLTLEEIQQDYMIDHITRLMRSLNQIDMSEVCSKMQNIFMDNLLKWRKIAIPMFPLSADYPENRKSLLPSIEGILSEDTLSAIRELLPSEYDPVFCHGDLLAGNVLYKAGSNQGLIDFEYAGYSYRAFDMANVIFFLTNLMMDNMINESHIDNSEPEWPNWGFIEKYKADNERIAKWVKAYGEGIDFWVEVKVFI